MSLSAWTITLLAGCTLTISVWTGSQILIDAGTKLDQFATTIVKYEENENKLVQKFNEQKNEYIHDVGKLKDALNRANEQVNKANADAAALKIKLDASVTKVGSKAPLGENELKLLTVAKCNTVSACPRGETHSTDNVAPEGDK